MKNLYLIVLLVFAIFPSNTFGQSISLGTISTNALCKGSTNLTIAYSLSGTFVNNQVSVLISDKDGSFINAQTLAISATSPISATVPSNYPSGVNYKIKLVTASPAVQSAESGSITFSPISTLNIYNTKNDNITYNELNIMCTGRVLTITTALTDTSGMTFQWKKDGVNIAGATSSKYRLNSQGRYTVSATQGNCPTINSPYGPYVYYYNTINWTTSVGVSGSTTQCNGGSVGLFAAAYTDSVGYQWYRDNQIITGATSRSYIATQSGVYKYVGLDGGCNYNGTTPRLSIINTPISVSVVDSLNRTTANICSGSNIKLMANTLGGDSQNLSFSWQKNNITISGANSSTYITNQAGTYKSIVTQLNCGNTSASYNLATTNLLQTSITSVDSVKCLGQSITLSSNYYTPTALYQWKKNNQNILGANSQNYNASLSGAYTLSISDYSCNGTSNIKTLQIGGIQQSLKTSSWTDLSTWSCGTIPTSIDEITINTGHIVTIPDNYSSMIKKLILKGSLLHGINSKIEF